MTKHDTWVKLKPGNPYEPILDFFANGMIPMRDPFPMERTVDQNGEEVALWIIDVERLSSIQFQSLAQIIAIYCKTDAVTVALEAELKGGFSMSHEWVASMQCWVEGFARSKELADFFETAPESGTPEGARAFVEFCNTQYERWIDGNQEPRQINSIEDIDPRLRTPELEQIFNTIPIEFAIANGGFSVFDVITGQAFTHALNIIDPENSYSLVGDDDEFNDDEFDDDEIYE
ncbi:MAG: hypothetical protein RM368_36140 [Nostoc sp. DedSLP03]|uniref:hypothetical protein n=1 Tax=Nostoc sp. DedSLP03 TaxID=3075400 RepID=UPI002AD48F89|nr:hypothetical protein [Nostoc sp. DedSLP03]MDZ7970302.1 hypothetical protein [Nostoc sp. DedSLP03]